MSDYSQGPGWWQASDGKWYPPQSQPGAAPPPPPPPQYGEPYGYAAPATDDWKPTAALVLGIVSIPANICFVPSILAIVWGSQARARDSKAQWGFVLGIIGIVISILGGIILVSARNG